ncbi:MAG: hypothetical protein IOC86_09290 [Aestuariivirga sp.]|nr:hypothetical protein [Aestuariivirga sp.]
MELELLDELDELLELELLDELDELLELELLDELDELLELELLDELDELLELELLDELLATLVYGSTTSGIARGAWSRSAGTAAAAAEAPSMAAPASVVTVILKFFICVSCCERTVNTDADILTDRAGDYSRAPGAAGDFSIR